MILRRFLLQGFSCSLYKHAKCITIWTREIKKKKRFFIFGHSAMIKIKAICFKIVEEIFTYTILVRHFNSVYLGLREFSP